MSSPIVSWYEASGDEPRRLLSGRGLIEAARTKELVERHLPPGSLTILDVGGGAGSYASWLASLGHQVAMLDPVALHIERARSEAGDPPAFQAQVGAARELPFDDATFDAVLLLGPLYHLLDSQDRLLALRETRRVSKPGAVVFAAAISRHALAGDGIRNGWLDDEAKQRSVEHVIAHGLTAPTHQGFLPMSYCHRADELREELASAELPVEAVYGIEGPAFLVADIDEKWADPATRERLLWAARLVELEPGLQEISGHLLAVGRRSETHRDAAPRVTPSAAGYRRAMDDDPFRQFAAWWGEEHVPMVLATAGPTARAVVLEDFDERGFVFWTSTESPKGRALAADPRAALVWLWDGRQARVEGRVEPVSDAENERHWKQREGKRQLAAFRQTEPVESRDALLAMLAAVPDSPARPPFWRGYRVVPERFDFWIADDDYVHDRFEYVRDGGRWRLRRLQP